MKGTKRRIIDPKRMKPKTVPIIERPKKRTGGKKTDPALLERAKNMFLSNATNTEIAEACQVTLTTVGTWIKKGDWHHIRNAAMNIPKTAHKVVMKAYEDIDKEINNEKPNYEQIEKLKKLADVFSKNLDIQALTTYSAALIEFASDPKIDVLISEYADKNGDMKVSYLITRLTSAFVKDFLNNKLNEKRN